MFPQGWKWGIQSHFKGKEMERENTLFHFIFTEELHRLIQLCHKQDSWNEKLYKLYFVLLKV